MKVNVGESMSLVAVTYLILENYYITNCNDDRYMHIKMTGTKAPSKGWFSLAHKHKHKPTYAEALRC